MQNERPNILLIMVDQLADQWLDLALTPAIDRLAAEGVRFGSTYSNSPLCAPARFAMMSGQLNSKIGAYDNASEFPSSVPTFAHHLRGAGYQTSLVGKMHFVGPDQLHGFEERLTTDIYPADFGWTPNWTDPDGRFDWWFHNMDSVTNAGVAEASNQLDYDDEVGFRSVRKLRDLARSSDDRPWLLTVSFTHPHDPYVARREFWDLYSDVDLPGPTVGPVAEPDPHSKRLAHVISADVTEVDDVQIAAARRAYLANTSYADRFIGQMLDTLARHSMDDNTAVIFTADHGDMLGERGLWYKMNFFEPSARVPLIVRLPGRSTSGRSTSAKQGRVDPTMTSLLDIAPTLLELAGLEKPPIMDGDSVLGLLDSSVDDAIDDAVEDTRRGPADKPASNQQGTRRTVLGEYLGEGAIAPIVMIRRGDYKFVWSEPDPPQLYDLANDPAELTNLAESADQSVLVAQFEAEVAQRWDTERLNQEVLVSQQARAVVDAALRQGRYQAWDFQPFTDATNQYMRNHLDLNDVESSRRLI